MKNLIVSISFLLLSYGLTVTVNAQDHTAMQRQGQGDHKMITTDKLEWQDGPPGLPAGAKIAILDGDPSKEGLFLIRVTLPANYKIAPHWHSATEHLTVIKGTLYMGTGEKADIKTATALKEGGYALMPAKAVHYVLTKDQVVFQVTALGPFDINYINEADDPRKNKKMR